MNCDDFERMVVMICNHILGQATIPFAKGKDGGKDGKFIGRANCIPSEAQPWDGKIIIQAKHTEKINASCSDSDFSRRLNHEIIPSIKKLKANGDIDFYLLFTNCKLTGIKDSVIEKKIKDETGVPTILVADEKIQDLLGKYPDVVRQAELNRLLLPFEFDESDIESVVVSLAHYVKSTHFHPLEEDVFEYPGLERKNILNKMGQDYFQDVIRISMDDFERIKVFLSEPANNEIAEYYDSAVSELNAKITLSRDQFYGFQYVLEAIYDSVISRYSEELGGNKRLVRTVLHYMYCNCDIGRKS